jgi:two-component system, sensor histidine kinase and response regulator
MPDPSKILIVDDQPANLFALEQILNRLDVQIIQASSGAQALSLSLDHDFSVAIVDVQMPEMDGYELVELLRGNQSTTALPVIFVSAVYSDDYHHRKAYDAGAVDFLSKPYIPEILLSKVKVFLDLYAERRKLQNLIEQLNESNRQLEIVNQELEGFATSVSHELRTPLRAIEGYSRILFEDYSSQLDLEAQTCLNNIKVATERMSTLINDMLHFAYHGVQPLNRQRVSMRQVVEEAIKELNGLAEQPRVKISVADLPDALADPSLIRQVYLNLLNNAIKYSRSRPAAAIQVGYRIENDQVIYWVSDNGVGFDMRYAGRLFGIFQRLHRQDEFEGSGVGLASVSRIINRHGGRIWAQAEVNKGATFYFTLPEDAR